MAVSQLVGAKIHRREDPRLITGHGHYIDDFARQGTAYAAFVRSPHAHARIKRIDVTDASKAPGVVGVYTARDFKGQLAGTHPAAPAFVADKKYIPERFPIAEKEVCYQGEIVAVVLADTKGQASDAANMIQVDYAELPAVMDLEKALEDGSPKAHEGGPDNVCWDLTYTGPEVTEAAFQEADTVVKQRILQNRLAPVPMEPRGVMAEYEGFDKKLTIWMSSQNPHFIRLFVSGAMGLKESQVRVISPDVGGGFGSKISPYPEDYLVPALSRIAERPVKWIETRTESIQNATHGRGQFYDVEVAAKKDGTLSAMRMTQYLDLGAYHGTFGGFQAVACLMAGGAYRWPGGISARTIGILTKNFIQPNEFPFTQHFGLVVDSGDYEKALDVALKLAGYDELRKQQAEGRKQGKLLGIGFSTWIELCGFGPSAATAPATGGIALVESAQVRVTPTGSVIVYTGTHAHGQGHETTFSQIVADQLGVPMESIELHHGDTGEGTSFGYGTYGSRSLAVGGVAVSKAVGKVIDKGKKLAAHMLEAAEEDVVYENGSFHVKGSPDKAKAFGEVAFASYGMSLPPGMEQGLEAVAYFDPPNLVWPFGTHISAVEIAPETGNAQLQKYIAVDDCGNIINPMIVDGQIHGGVAQAIAQALYEEVVYDDETGQLKTGTLLDYSIPGIGEIPKMDLDHTVTPSPTNDLGVKGIGEAGTIAASAAVINAICDALSPLGIKHVDMPASPDRLWHMMKGASK